jgi:hypothetical protein
VFGPVSGSMAERRRLTDEQIERAFGKYLRGAPVKALAIDYGVHYETMRKYLRQRRKGVA